MCDGIPAGDSLASVELPLDHHVWIRTVFEQPLESRQMVVRKRPQQWRHLVFALRVDVGACLDQPLHFTQVIGFDRAAQRDHLRVGEVDLGFPPAPLVKTSAREFIDQTASGNATHDDGTKADGLKEVHRFAQTLLGKVGNVAEQVDRDVAEPIFRDKQPVEN